MPADDNAQLIYSQSRSDDAALEDEALRSNEMASLVARMQASQPQASATPTPSEEPSEAPVSEEGGDGTGELFDAGDVAKGALRGPLVELADFVDNLHEVSKPVRSRLAGIVTKLAFAGRPQAASLANVAGEQKEREVEAAESTVRETADEVLGTPETLSGGLTQGVSGQLAYIVPLMRGVKVTGAVSSGVKFFGVPAAVAGATQGRDEGNLSNLVEDHAPNPFTELLALDADDSVVDRFAKTALEDIVIGGTFEVLARGIGKTLSRGKKGAAAISDDVTKAGIEPDTLLEEAADNVVVARTEAELAEAALKQADEAAEAAEFAGDQLDLFPELREMLEQKAANARTALVEAEGSLASAADASTAHGGYMESIRQVVADGGLGKEANEALGRAATRNAVAPPPPKTVVGNYLEADPEQAANIARAIDLGDTDAAIDGLADIYDSTNFERIAESGNITDLLESLGRLGGNSPNSKRLQGVRGLVDTEDMALQEVTRLAEENGSSIEAVVDALDQSLPGANLDVKLNSLRMAELSIARKVSKLSDKMNHAEWSDLDRAELMRWATVLANVSDRRAGVVSEIGRALSSLRIEASGENFTNVLDAVRELQVNQVTGILDSHGGQKAIDRFAAAVNAGTSDDIVAEMAQAVMDSHTLGDTLHNVFINNILSGAATQAVNVGSNTFIGAMWEPSNLLFSAGALSLKNGNLTAFREFNQYVHGMMIGAKQGVRMNGSLTQGKVFQAFKRGRRSTADSPRGKFDDGTRGSLLTAEKLNSLVRRGAPVRVPFRGLGGAVPQNMPLFPLPKRARNAIADYVIPREGPGARAVDFLGRIFEWPLRALAAGDELAAGINYNARLHADAYASGIQQGLQGAELATYAQRAIRRSPKVVQMAKRIRRVQDPAKRAALERQLAEYGRLDKSAADTARRLTFTEPASGGTEAILKLKQNFPMLRWFIPFVNTPTQLFASGVKDFTPIGPGAQLVQQLSKGNADKAAEAAGRVAFVGGVNYAIFNAVGEGRVTGGGPHDPRERELWLAAGNVPYSIDVPGYGKVQYNRLDPLALPMALQSDLMPLIGKLDEVEGDMLLQEFWGIMLEQVKSKSYMEGLSNFLHLIEGDERYARRMVVSNVANVVTPWSRFWAGLNRGGLPVPEDLVITETDDTPVERLLKDVARGNPERIQVQDEGGIMLQLGSTIGKDLPAGADEAFLRFWQKVVARDIEVSQTPQRDFYGDIRTNNPAVGPDVASPFPFRPETGDLDPLSTELSRLGFGISVNQRFGSILGVDLSPKQQDRFQRAFAQPKGQPTIRKLLESVVFDEDGEFSSTWQSLGDSFDDLKGGRETVIARIVGARIEAAQARLLSEDAELAEAVRQVREDRLKVMTDEGSREVTKRRLEENSLPAILNIN